MIILKTLLGRKKQKIDRVGVKYHYYMEDVHYIHCIMSVWYGEGAFEEIVLQYNFVHMKLKKKLGEGV